MYRRKKVTEEAIERAEMGLISGLEKYDSKISNKRRTKPCQTSIKLRRSQHGSGTFRKPDLK